MAEGEVSCFIYFRDELLHTESQRGSESVQTSEWFMLHNKRF